jgi:hypothetical protein
VAVRAREVAGWPPLYATLTDRDAADEAWFIHGEACPPGHPTPRWDDPPFFLGTPRTIDLGPGVPARSARLKSWDGRVGTVDHDGTCYLIVRRTYYPGWFATVDDGPPRPVLKANGGLQAVALTGQGTSRVAFAYHPTGLRPAATISLAATAAALLTLIAGIVGDPRRWARRSPRP